MALMKFFAVVYALGCISSFLWIWMNYLFGLQNLRKYMEAHHKVEWDEINQKAGWFELLDISAMYGKPVGSQKVLSDFVWKSKEDFDDSEVSARRKSIRSIVWKVPLWFALVISVMQLLIFTDLYAKAG